MLTICMLHYIYTVYILWKFWLKVQGCSQDFRNIRFPQMQHKISKFLWIFYVTVDVSFIFQHEAPKLSSLSFFVGLKVVKVSGSCGPDSVTEAGVNFSLVFQGGLRGRSHTSAATLRGKWVSIQSVL